MSRNSDQIDRALASLTLSDAFLLIVAWLVGLICLADFGINWALMGSPNWIYLIVGLTGTGMPLFVIYRTVNNHVN